MLVLTRKLSEVITIGDTIEVMIVDIRQGRVKLGIVAPGLRVGRKEHKPKTEKGRSHERHLHQP